MLWWWTPSAVPVLAPWSRQFFRPWSCWWRVQWAAKRRAVEPGGTCWDQPSALCWAFGSLVGTTCVASIGNIRGRRDAQVFGVFRRPFGGSGQSSHSFDRFPAVCGGGRLQPRAAAHILSAALHHCHGGQRPAGQYLFYCHPEATRLLIPHWRMMLMEDDGNLTDRDFLLSS